MPILKVITLIILMVQSLFTPIKAQQKNQYLLTEELIFKSEGVTLVGTLYKPKKSNKALVIVHGSCQERRMDQFAENMAKKGITVFTYDKRGVGSSGGIYAGPEVGTNSIDATNINLLAKDVNALHKKIENIPIGLIGGSQAGWIIPITANQNPLFQFMVLYSCPTITTLEQLRFQFYTNGDTQFWETHTETKAHEHLKNDADHYQFEPTDPKISLNKLSIPGLWLFGEKDIQIPVKLYIEDLNAFKAKGKLFEYTLFPNLGHNTFFESDQTPFDIAMQWIKQ